MKQARFKSEADLGLPVIAWLTSEGFDVYQEVNAWRGVADLVGVCGPQLCVVELKLSLSFELLYQALRWREVAHVVWAAVPRAKPSDGRTMAIRCYADRGIGVLEVEPTADGGEIDLRRRHPVARPAFNRSADTDRVRRHLCDEHKTFAAAGSAGGRHWSDFKATCSRVREYLASHDGASIRDVVRDVQHHYASDAGARSRLVELIRRGVVPGLREEGGRLFRTEAA